jgi:hypothetical protein
MSYHHLAGPEDAHVIHSWVYATLADRDAHNPEEGSEELITAGDVSLHRICYVREDDNFYFLVALGVWKQLNP